MRSNQEQLVMQANHQYAPLLVAMEIFKQLMERSVTMEILIQMMVVIIVPMRLIGIALMLKVLLLYVMASVGI